MYQLINNIFKLEHKYKSNKKQITCKSRINRKEPDENEPYHYSSTTTSYFDVNGLTHKERKEYDSTHRTNITKSRKICDNNITRNREIDFKEELRKKHNIEDGKIEAFKEEWKSRERERTESVFETLQF
jgi:hypothetical protein